MAIVPYDDKRSVAESGAALSLDRLAKQVANHSHSNSLAELKDFLTKAVAMDASIEDPVAQHGFREAANGMHLKLMEDLNKISSITNDAARAALNDFYRGQ